MHCTAAVLVPIVPAQARVAMAEAFGRQPEEVFEWLSDRPVAAASLGQVRMLETEGAQFRNSHHHLVPFVCMIRFDLIYM